MFPLENLTFHFQELLVSKGSKVTFEITFSTFIFRCKILLALTYSAGLGLHRFE